MPGLDEVIAQLGYEIRLLSANPTYYPWAIIPPDGKSFDIVATIGMPAAGGGVAPSPGTETVVLTYKCPLGYNGIVYRISNNFLGPTFNPQLPSIVWRIRNGPSISNSKFVDNYNNIVVEFGSTAFPREISGIFVKSGQTLLYTVQNGDPTLPVSPVTQTTCCLSGFIWPEQRQAQVRQGKRGNVATIAGGSRCA